MTVPWKGDLRIAHSINVHVDNAREKIGLRTGMKFFKMRYAYAL